MSASNNFTAILDQWLQLTKAESAAIQSASWPVLGQIQARKAALRPSLAEALRHCASGPLRAQAGRIISLLTRNAAALDARLRQARERRVALDQVARNLRRISRSYSQPPRPAAWHSYS